MSDRELDDLIAHFDRDGDKLISIDEFQHFCLAIDHPVWRRDAELFAEEQRAARENDGAAGGAAAEQPTGGDGEPHRGAPPSP